MSVYIQGSYVPSWREFSERTRRMQNNFENQLNAERERARAEARQQARIEADRTRQEFNRQINTAINGVNENIRRIDEANSRRIQQLSDEIHTSINHLQNDITRVDARVDNVNERLTNVVRQVNDRFEHQDARINNLETNVRNLYNYISDRSERGRQAAADALTMFNEYMKKYPIREYLPEEAANIGTALECMPSIPEDAIPIAQQIIIDLQNAARQAVTLHAAHQAMVEYTDSVLNAVLTMINNNRKFTYNDEGEPVEIESDFWSRGRYSELQEEINALREEMEGNPDNDRLQAICIRSQELDAEAASIRETAIKKAMESEGRLILAENLVSAYIQQGYEIKLNPTTKKEEIGYMGGDVDEDWREGVYAIVIGPTGEEITVMVNPEDGRDGNRILFHRNDTRPLTAQEYIDSIKRVCAISRKVGYEVEDPQAPEGCDDKIMEELSNGTEIKKRGTAEKVKAI